MFPFREGRAVLVTRLALLASLSSCQDLGPSSGTIALSVTITANYVGASQVDSYQVELRDSENRRHVQYGRSGDTLEFGDLEKGAYQVALLGLVGTQVETFGFTGVEVEPGESRVVNITPRSFQPSLQSLPTLSVQGPHTVSWSAVAGADSYVLEHATDDLFRNPQSVSTNNTSAAVEFGLGRHFIRVRAVNSSFVPAPLGRPSSLESIEVVTPVLVFVTEPGLTVLGRSVPTVRVAIRDAQGRLVSSSRDPVSLQLDANPTGANLSGTTAVNAVDGVASFTNLALDQWGIGYRLRATLADGVTAVSSPFDVRLQFSRVSGGEWHTCGLVTTGVVYWT